MNARPSLLFEIISRTAARKTMSKVLREYLGEEGSGEREVGGEGEVRGSKE